jgi:hypothetical protein
LKKELTHFLEIKTQGSTYYIGRSFLVAERQFKEEKACGLKVERLLANLCANQFKQKQAAVALGEQIDARKHDVSNLVRRTNHSRAQVKVNLEILPFFAYHICVVVFVYKLICHHLNKLFICVRANRRFTFIDQRSAQMRLFVCAIDWEFY